MCPEEKLDWIGMGPRALAAASGLAPWSIAVDENSDENLCKCAASAGEKHSIRIRSIPP